MDNKIQYSKPVPPFVKFCAANIPMVFDDSLSYYEALCALWKWLQTDVIDVINNNAAVTQLWREELTTFENNVTDEIENFETEMHSDFSDLNEAFNTLKTWVETYFDNLDVQEEINNKLDEMAEQGVLADIVAAYIQLRGVLAYDTVHDMANAENITVGSFCETYGFYSKGDGGSAKYKIRNITNDDVVDGITIISIDSDPTDTLIAELILTGDMTAKQFGAKGDGVTDDSTYFQTMLNKLNYVYAPEGSYVVELNVNTAEAKICGAGYSTILIGKDNTNVITLGANANTYEIKDLVIDADNKAEYGIKQASYNTEGRYDCHGIIKDCEIMNATIDGLFICVNARANEYINLYIHTNGNNGFSLCASDSFITNCTFADNGNNGIELKKNTVEVPANSDNNIITGCKAFYNGANQLDNDNGNGFQICSSRNMITNCNSQENFGSGFFLDYLSESNNITSFVSDGNGTLSPHDTNAYGVHIKGANNIINGSVNNAILNGGISAVLCFDGKYAFNNNVDVMFTNYTARDNADYGMPNCILVKNNVNIPFNRIKINGDTKDIGTLTNYLTLSHGTDNDYPTSTSSVTVADGVVTIVMNGYGQDDIGKKVGYRVNIWSDFPTHHTVYLKCKGKITGVTKNNGFDARLQLTTGYTDSDGVAHRYIGGKYYNTGQRYSHILRNVDDWQDLILVADCSTVDTLPDYQSLWGMLISMDLFKNGTTTINSDVTVQFKDIEYLFY